MEKAVVYKNPSFFTAAIEYDLQAVDSSHGEDVSVLAIVFDDIGTDVGIDVNSSSRRISAEVIETGRDERLNRVYVVAGDVIVLNVCDSALYGKALGC